MKKSFYSCAFLALLLIFAYLSVISVQDQGKAEHDQVSKEKTKIVSETRTNELINEAMGMEFCHGEDEECLARRMVAEANLDYIYTQRHKP